MIDKLNIFFTDLDGTLEDSRVDMVQAIQRLRLQYGLNAQDADAQAAMVNKGMDFLYRNAFPEKLAGIEEGSPAEKKTLSRLAADYAAEYGAGITNHTVLYKGIAEMLGKINQTCLLVCYTNKPEQLSRLLLKQLNVIQFFDDVIGGDSYPQSKPHVVPMQNAARKLNFTVEKGRAYYLGDTTGDMRAAENFGAISIWCNWGYQETAPVDPAPDYQVQNPAEVLELISEK